VAAPPDVTADGSKVFVAGGDSSLYVNYWDGTQWQWAAQGKPSETKIPAVCNMLTMYIICPP